MITMPGPVIETFETNLKKKLKRKGSNGVQSKKKKEMQINLSHNDQNNSFIWSTATAQHHIPWLTLAIHFGIFLLRCGAVRCFTTSHMALLLLEWMCLSISTKPTTTSWLVIPTSCLVVVTVAKNDCELLWRSHIIFLSQSTTHDDPAQSLAHFTAFRRVVLAVVIVVKPSQQPRARVSVENIAAAGLHSSL